METNGNSGNYISPPFQIIMTVFLGIIFLDLADFMSIARSNSISRPITDQIVVSFLLLVITILSFVYFYQLIRYFEHDIRSIWWNYIVITGAAILILLASFRTPFFYSLLAVSVILIYLKFEQLVGSMKKYDASKFPKDFTQKMILKFTRMKHVVLVLAIVLSVIFGAMDVINFSYLIQKDNSTVSITNINDQGIANIFNRILIYDKQYIIKLSKDLDKIDISEQERKLINKDIRDIEIDIETIAFNMRLSNILLVAFLLIGFLYVFIISLRVKDLPSNNEIRKNLNEAFWKVENNNSNTPDSNLSRGGSNLEGKSLTFIAIKIFCLWPSLISALIAAQVTWTFSYSITNTILVFISVFSVTAYGFTINNIVDAQKDKYAVRKKYKIIHYPKAMEIAKIQAVIFVIIALSLALFLPLQSLIIIYSITGLLSIYSFINNKYGLISNILTAICVAALVWVYPISNTTSLLEISVLSSFMFFFVLSREIFMDDYDYHSDKSYGKKTLSISYGRKTAKVIALTTLIISTSLLSYIVFNYDLNIRLLIPIIGATAISLTGFILYYLNGSQRNFNIFFQSTSIAYITFFGVFLF